MHLYIGCNASDEIFSADSASNLPGLWLQLYELYPQVLGGPREVTNLGIGVETEHLWGIGERQGVDILQVGISVACTGEKNFLACGNVLHMHHCCG